MKPTYDYLYKTHVVTAVDCANAGLTEQQLNAWLESAGWRKSSDRPSGAYMWVREHDAFLVDAMEIHGGAEVNIGGRAVATGFAPIV